MMTRTLRRATLVLLSLTAFTACAQEEQGPYPKPLIHTPTNHPAARVLVLDVAGLSAASLASFLAAHPESALAALSAHGVAFTNVRMPIPAPDATAGLVALVTGGTPISTGILGSSGYDRSLSPPGSACKTRGAAITESGPLDPKRFPLDPAHGCTPVAPHALLRVNTLFDTVQQKGGRTAWAGADAASTDLMRGPTGNGLTEACALPTDDARIAAVLHWIDGHDCAGTGQNAVPTLFGMSFSGLAAQPATLGTIDRQIGRLAAALKTKHLFDSTWIFVTAAYAQAPPFSPAAARMVPQATLAQASGVQPLAVVTGSGVAMVWLHDPAQSPTAQQAYRRNAATLGIATFADAATLALSLNDPAQDPRMPDLILTARPGVVWSATGGDAETPVAMLISGRQLTGRFDKTPLPATQMAPLLLRALGMEKFDLEALHHEHSPALPGIF